MLPLDGVRVVSLAVNLPGPWAASRLRGYGAHVTKVEPPKGDPLGALSPECYEGLTADMAVVALDLKAPEARKDLDELLAQSDLLLTASLPASLERLGLGWEAVHGQFPKLCYLAITGFPPPNENVPGHDLTYQADLGLLTPPHMPRALIADMAGAERAAAEALALLLARERSGNAGYRAVALADAAKDFAETHRRGITKATGVLGGGLPNYNIYLAKRGYLAVAALEPHYYQRLLAALGSDDASQEALAAIFLTRTAVEWEDWAKEHGLPLKAVRGSDS